MYGGYDLAITKYFGNELTNNVQKYIRDNLNWQQEVATSFIIDIPGTNKKLIHTPTMINPHKIKNEQVIFECMKNTLLCALRSNINSIVIPMFGGATGGIDPNIIAEKMYSAYKEVFNC